MIQGHYKIDKYINQLRVTGYMTKYNLEKGIYRANKI